MDALYDQTLKNMISTLRSLETYVAPPQLINQQESLVYRYLEKTIEQAIIQKLARLVTSLHSARLLLKHGFLQEQASIQRMFDEFHEDVLFLAFALISKDKTQLHQDYLDAFYEEEFDAPSPIMSTQKRPMVKREKIRAYVARSDLAGLDPSTGIELSRTINKTYSGFVHGASPQIMDMYGGSPLHFQVNGQQGTERHAEHSYDIWNYFFRAIVAFALAAKAFNDDRLFESIRKYHHYFDEQSGRNNAFKG